MDKKLIVFDLDGTLAESKSALDPAMATLLGDLLGALKVAVISGGDWPQFQKQLLAHLPDDGRLASLSLLPACGTKFYRHAGGWEKLYAEDFSPEDRDRIIDALNRAVDDSGVEPDRVWGDRIEDRGSQITFSALGQEAPLEEKKKWDPGFAKRRKIKERLDGAIPGFSVRLGGTTSVDVTRPGIDKAYGIGKLRETLGIGTAEMIFVGDALFPGGNDYPAEQAGVRSIRVANPGETRKVIETILACTDGGASPTPGEGP